VCAARAYSVVSATKSSLEKDSTFITGNTALYSSVVSTVVRYLSPHIVIVMLFAVVCCNIMLLQICVIVGHHDKYSAVLPFYVSFTAFIDQCLLQYCSH